MIAWPYRARAADVAYTEVQASYCGRNLPVASRCLVSYGGVTPECYPSNKLILCFAFREPSDAPLIGCHPVLAVHTSAPPDDATA